MSLMELHKKKKVEIVVEAAISGRVLKMLEDVGARGYTVVPQVSGKGNRGIRGEGHVIDVFRNVLIIVIAAPEVAVRIVEEAQPLLADYAGIVYLTDVEVVRAGHF